MFGRLLYFETQLLLCIGVGSQGLYHVFDTHTWVPSLIVLDSLCHLAKTGSGECKRRLEYDDKEECILFLSLLLLLVHLLRTQGLILYFIFDMLRLVLCWQRWW